MWEYKADVEFQSVLVSAEKDALTAQNSALRIQLQQREHLELVISSFRQLIMAGNVQLTAAGIGQAANRQVAVAGIWQAAAAALIFS